MPYQCQLINCEKYIIRLHDINNIGKLGMGMREISVPFSQFSCKKTELGKK